MPNQVDNLLLDDDTTGLPRTINTSSDDIVLSVDLTLQSGGILTADNIKRGTADPNAGAGTAGNEGDLYQRTLASTGELYVNTDGTNTGWDLVIADATAYLRRDGTTTLTANWAVGGFDITGVDELGAVSGAFSGNIIAGNAVSASVVSNFGPTPTRFVQAGTTTSTDTVGFKLYVNEGSRNTRVGFFLTDAATIGGAWGHWLSFGSGGAQPYVIGMASQTLLYLAAISQNTPQTSFIAASQGNATIAGGVIEIRGGAGGATSGAGGAATVQGGTPTEGAGGDVNITGAAGVGTNRAGGAVVVTAGASTGNANAGDISITAGTGGTSAIGGDTEIRAGSGGSASGLGGAASLIGGTGPAGGGGSASVQGGTAVSGQGGQAGLFGGSSSGSTAGGEIYILGGAGGPTGVGGVVTIEGGAGGATSGNGGNVLLVGGAETSGSLGVVRITNTALEFIESATVQGPAIAATQGRFWVRNDVPNVPMFTDDTGTDHNLLRGAGDWKDSVRVATTASIALSGEQTIDGVSVEDGDRVLVKDQDATITTAMITGSSELATDSATFVDANCSSSALASGDWFVIGLANHRNNDSGSSGFGSEVEARIGSTRFAVSSWNSINGQFNLDDDAAGGCLSVFARVTSSGSDTLNMRARALENAATEEILVGSQAFVYFRIGSLTENTDYWAAEAANSDSAEVTPNGDTWTASEQLVFTPTETGSYLIMASAEGFNTGDNSISNEYQARLRMNGSTIGTETEMKCDIANFGTTTAVFGPNFTMIDVRTLTSSVEYTINWEFRNVSGFSDLSYRRSRIYVFRLAAFVDSETAVLADGIEASNETEEGTSTLTFDFGASPVTALVLAGCDYANGGAWGSGWLRRDGTPDVDYPPDGRMWAVVETGLGATNDFMPLNFAAVQTGATNSQVYRFVGMSEDTPTITFGRTRGNGGNSRMVLVALRMESSASASQNGIYTCSTGAWSRSADANTSAEVTSMLTVGVEEGTMNMNTFWYLATMNPITLGTTGLVFAELGGAPANALTQPEVLARISLGF